MFRKLIVSTAIATVLSGTVAVMTTGRIADGLAQEPGTLTEATYDHMSIHVADFDGALTWYQDILGFELEVAWQVAALDGKRLAYLIKNGTRIELVAADPGAAGFPPPATFAEHFARTGFGHLCFLVDDVDVALAELEARGVATFVRGETYALDGTPYERRVGFVQDPEGNVIEFAEPLRRRSTE